MLYSERTTTTKEIEMNEIQSEAAVSESGSVKMPATQVIGEVVIIAGVLYLGYRVWNAAVNRAARRQLRKQQ